MADGGGEKVKARTPREMEMQAEARKITELLRFALLSCDTTRQDPREMKMEAESWDHMGRMMLALFPCCESFEQCFDQLTKPQRRLFKHEQLKLDSARSLTRIISLLEEHVTRLQTQDIANKLDGGGGDKEEVDMDRGKSGMEEQLPSIDSRITHLETEAEAVMEGESGKLMEQQSEVLKCGSAAQVHYQNKTKIHDVHGADGSGDKDKAEVEMGRAKSLDILKEGEYLNHLQSELEMMEVKYVKQLQFELRSHLESLKELVGNPEMEDKRWGMRRVVMDKAQSFLRQRGYKNAHFKVSNFISNWMSDRPSPREKKTRGSSSWKQRSHPSFRAPVPRGSNKGKHIGHATAHPESMGDLGESLLLLQDQAKMEEGSSNSGEQQVPDIQDSESKSEPTIDDPFIGFLLDMPFTSPDDDDNKEDTINRGKSAELIPHEEEILPEEKKFASYRKCWEDNWKAIYGFFEDMTTVSPMHFTHSTPGCGLDYAACFAPTLQIFTLKLAEIKGGLEYPLSVYGVVAARDDVDHNRNLLFSCDRSESQKVDQDDPFLCLIGPSRAVVFTDHVKFEVQLRVRGRTVSEDRALISDFYHYTGGYCHGVSTICFENCFCTAELCMEQIQRTVQATVLSVRVKNGPWPFEYGGEVACSSPSYNTAPSSMNVVLLASRGRPMPKGSDGYLHLTRNVVSVEVKGSLTFFIHAYSQSGEIAARGQVCFMPKDCNISKKRCFFGDPKVEVEIIVAWSALVSDKRLIAGKGGMFELLKEQGDV